MAVVGGQGYEYHLTPAGRDLERVIDAFGRWAIEWLFDELYPQEVDPHDADVVDAPAHRPGPVP